MLGKLLLGVTLILWSMVGFGWLTLDKNVVLVLAFITGIVLILEAFGVFNFNVRKGSN